MTSKPEKPEVVKEPSMLKQKAMIAENYEKLTSAGETGDKVVSTYVPGNLNELIMCFDMLNNLPEINAIQNGRSRPRTGPCATTAESSCREGSASSRRSPSSSPSSLRDVTSSMMTSCSSPAGCSTMCR